MEVRNKKHPHYPSGMVVNIPDARTANEMVSSGIWERVDAAVVVKQKKVQTNADDTRATDTPAEDA